jgi:hypothetical protein
VNKSFHNFMHENPVIDIRSFLSFIHNTYGVSYRYIAEVPGISSTCLSKITRLDKVGSLFWIIEIVLI